MIADTELLRRYAADRSEEAFAELVDRHLNLVYATALRRMDGRSDLAKDAAQSVFIDLARKALVLSRHPTLIGWLFTSANYAAAKIIRAEHRRAARENEAMIMNEIFSSQEPGIEWQSIRPVIDELILKLNRRDREAILLRFFEGLNYPQLGAELRLSEDGARSRVERTLEKLRTMLVRRGVASTATALALVLEHQGSVEAPVGFAAAVNGAVLANGTIGSAGFGAALRLFKFVTATKLNIAIVSAVCGLTISTVFYEANRVYGQGGDSAYTHTDWADPPFTNDKTDSNSVIQSAPTDAEAEYKLGFVLANLGRNLEAIRHLEKAVQLKPGNPIWLNTIGTVLARLGRATEASQEFERALQIKPDYAKAQQNLERIKVMLL